MFWLFRKKSGTKEYALLTSDNARELAWMAKKLKMSVHGKGAQEKHLDLSGYKIEVAKKHGAVEKDK